MKKLRFYHRPDCHLCEDMLEQLAELAQTAVFELQQVDVDDDAETRARYHTRVPVLEDTHGNLLSEIYLDQVTVLNYLRDA